MSSATALVAILAAAPAALSPVALPGGAGGIGLDDLRWSDELHALLVPAGRTGSVDLVDPGPPPALVRTGSVAVPGGPESLVVDPAGRRAYTNTFGDATVALDVRARAVAARWTNGCRGARGIDLDAARGILLVGCAEGKVVSLDAGSGAPLGEIATGAGVDGIAYGEGPAHVYVPAASGSVTVVGVGERGTLSALGSVAGAPGAHCAATDGRGSAWVCDPRNGRVLLLRDGYPASRPPGAR